MTRLRKHKPYNFLHSMPTEALCSDGARLLLVGHQGCEGGTWREHEPPGLRHSPRRGPGAESLVGGSGGPSLWQADMVSTGHIGLGIQLGLGLAFSLMSWFGSSALTES